MKHVRSGMIALLVALTGSILFAQEDKPAPLPTPAAPAPPAESRPARDAIIVPLRLQLVLSRYDGDKKVSSLPYSFIVNAGDGRGTQLRMGVEVPVPVTTFTATKDMAPAVSYQYRNVGANIDVALAQVLPDGRYRLHFTVEQSSVQLPDQRPAAGSAASGALAGAFPMFRSYKSSFAAVVRDGQSMQFTAATDPVSGEVSKVDLTVNVVK
jgi:hypothetical protein